MTHQWSYDLEGVINAQPLYAGGVVFAGSETGRFAAIDAQTGEALWTRRVASVDTTCADVPGGVHAISATPVLKGDTIWVAGGRGRVWAFDRSSGKTRPGWPVKVGGRNEHIWGALAMSRGRLYVATASYCNNAFYRGRVVALNPETGRKRAQWQALGKRGYGAGVWGWGGVVVDPADGDVYLATANAQGKAEGKGLRYAEEVVRLSKGLKFEQANDPGPPRRADNDFTGAPILFRAPGCPAQLAVMHKTGQLFLYDRARIKSGPRQRIQAGDLKAFIALGTYAWSQERRTLFLANGSAGAFQIGLVALRLNDGCRLELSWQQPAPKQDPTWPTVPVVAGGVVLYGDGSGQTLRAFDADDGTPLWNSGEATGDLYGAPIVADGRLFAPSWDHKVHAFAPG